MTTSAISHSEVSDGAVRELERLIEMFDGKFVRYVGLEVLSEPFTLNAVELEPVLPCEHWIRQSAIFAEVCTPTDEVIHAW